MTNFLGCKIRRLRICTSLSHSVYGQLMSLVVLTLERLKIDSEVATDNDKDEFLGNIYAPGMSQVVTAANMLIISAFFQNKIQELSDKYMDYPLLFLNQNT
jgi:hypothetical protein